MTHSTKEKSRYLTNFYFLVGFVIVTELSYGLCQEVLYGTYKFPHAWFSTFMQCVCYGIFSAIQGSIQTGRLPSYRKETFPHFGHLMIGSASLISRVSGNMAFKYMDYGLKVLFTSANPILVMATGIFYKQSYTIVEYLSTSMLAMGLILFSYADFLKPGGVFGVLGVILMLISVSTDALKMRTQELVMKQHKCSEVDVTYWSSIFGAICSFVLVIFAGQLIPSIVFFMAQPIAFVWMIMIFVFGYASSIATLSLIIISDAFVASIISSTRKALTVFISFVTFGKQVTFQHVVAIALFFVGILWQSTTKRKKAKKV